MYEFRRCWFLVGVFFSGTGIYALTGVESCRNIADVLFGLHFA